MHQHSGGRGCGHPERQEFGETRGPAAFGERNLSIATPREPPQGLTLPGVAAAATLEGEEVGVEAVAAQAQVGPPDGVALVRVQDELPLRQLHHPRAQLVPLIVHVGHLQGDTAGKSEPRIGEELRDQ